MLEKADKKAACQGTTATAPEHVLSALLEDLMIREQLKTQYGINADHVQAALTQRFPSTGHSGDQTPHRKNWMTQSPETAALLDCAHGIRRKEWIGTLDLLKAFFKSADTPTGALLCAAERQNRKPVRDAFGPA
ncbi:MAG: hypothetical protein HYU57_09045 [Micavibrio aeruginosavorus]|nr:hypothetical protein [Micavibrio aeruginosavorus]